MGNETELTMRFKVNDDGSVVLDKIGKNIQGIENQTTRMNSSLSMIKWSAMANLGEQAFHVAERLYGVARRAAEATNEIDRNAKIAGLSTDTYQKMAYAAKMTDVDMDSLGKGMKILAGHMDDVRKGGDQAVSLFQSIGVATIDASGKTKSFNEILGDLADRFKSMPDGVDKVALSTDLFGRAGERLIPFLNQGKQGLTALYQEAEKLGIVLDEQLIKKGSELEDRFKKAEAWWGAFFKKIVIGAYEGIDAMQKFNKTWGMEEGRGARQALGIEKKTPAKVEPTAVSPTNAAVTYIRQSEEAMKAVAKAIEKANEQEVKMNALFADDVELMKQMNREVERRNKSMEIMEQLGVKTKKGAEGEIASIQERYKMLMGQGYSPEEMTQAKAKLEEQLKAVEAKYKTESGWKAVGEEGETRWWSNIVPKEGVGAEISKMVTEAINELNRMQTAAEAATGPKTIMIDYSPVQNANAAVEALREKLDAVDGRVITITIDQRVKGDQIEAIEEGLAMRFSNKQSRLGSIIRKEIEGVTYYGNE